MVKLVKSFHHNMWATIRLDGTVTEGINVQNGVRQRCCMAPVLFNLCTCIVMERWLSKVGVMAFLWGFWNAVQRSRAEDVSVTQLFMLLGSATPASVRRTMLLALLVQVATAFATTFWRLDGPDGTPGSSLAVGMLVPMFGLGMNGLWAAYHADFAVRELPDTSNRIVGDPDGASNADGEPDARTTDGGTKPTTIDQNEHHG